MLSVLTVVTDPGEAEWVAQFDALRQAAGTYYSIVIIDKASDRIVAVGTIFVERKFLRGLGRVGHIEDIAVDERQQGKKLGLRIIQALTAISENSGCYKTILNCSDKNIRESPLPSCCPFVAIDASCRLAFYQKCGYQQKENEMVRYVEHVTFERGHSSNDRQSTPLSVHKPQSSRAFDTSL